MNIICPVCRSELKPIGSANFNADSLQLLRCPICNAPISLSSGFPIPQKYTGFQIVVYRKPVVLWEDVKSNLPSNTSLDKVTEENKQSIYKDFSIAGGLKESVKSVSSFVGETTGNVAEGLIEGTSAGLIKALGTPLLIGVIILLIVALAVNRK